MRLTCPYSAPPHEANLLRDVLNKEWRSSEVVDGEVKEPLDLLVVEVHGEEVGHARLGQHGGQELGHYAAPLAHLALPAVGKVGDYSWRGGGEEREEERGEGGGEGGGRRGGGRRGGEGRKERGRERGEERERGEGEKREGERARKRERKRGTFYQGNENRTYFFLLVKLVIEYVYSICRWSEVEPLLIYAGIY